MFRSIIAIVMFVELLLILVLSASFDFSDLFLEVILTSILGCFLMVKNGKKIMSGMVGMSSEQVAEMLSKNQYSGWIFLTGLLLFLPGVITDTMALTIFVTKCVLPYLRGAKNKSGTDGSYYSASSGHVSKKFKSKHASESNDRVYDAEFEEVD